VPLDAPPLPSPSASQSAASWDVSLDQSGGFAGVRFHLEISSDGRLSAENQKTGQRVTQDLDAATLEKLSGLVSALASSAPQAPQQSNCADCFLYDLRVTSGARSVHVQADDTTLGASGARELIALLMQLRDAALKG
jgi:hypothetical protein